MTVCSLSVLFGLEFGDFGRLEGFVKGCIVGIKKLYKNTSRGSIWIFTPV